jgi:hypothetical protein
MKRFDERRFPGLEAHLEFCLDNVLATGATLDEIGRFYEEAEEALRAHAILRLLVDADVDGFATDLVTSGFGRRSLLRRAAREGYTGYLLASGRSNALFDALAADDLDLARELHAVAPPTWRQGDEYEDHFWYRRILGLVASGAAAADLDPALVALERAAEGAGAAIALCRALQARDADAFAEAFHARIAERRAEVAEDLPLADDHLPTALGTKLFVEGVALLKLARAAGLPVAREYPMCPALALLSRRNPTRPPDPFPRW